MNFCKGIRERWIVGCLMATIFMLAVLLERSVQISTVITPGIQRCPSCYAETRYDVVMVIPEDEELRRMDNNQRTDLYWRYTNSLQVLCTEQTRMGSFRDGGKEVCVDKDFIPRKPCLVYSFGSNYQFDFEINVIKAFGCEVHTFDPTKAVGGRKIPDGIQFHLIGLSDRDYKTKQGWTMQTMNTTMKALGHEQRTIDILKVDIEGGEWESFEQMCEAGTLGLVKQMQIEIHWNDNDSVGKLRWFRHIYRQGFRIFMRDRNLVGLRKLQSKFTDQVSNLMEISLLNIRYKK